MCLLVLLRGGRTLQIMKAKVSDGGKYSCVAMNAAGEAHRHIYLTVFGNSTPAVCPQSVCILRIKRVDFSVPFVF